MMLFSETFLGLILFVLGITIFIKLFFKIELPSQKALVSFVLIYMGFGIMGSNLRIFPGKQSVNTIIFGNREIAVKDLKTDYKILFGNGNLDFTQATLPKGASFIEVYSLFSIGNILIPNAPTVKVVINPVLSLVKYPGNTNSFPLTRRLYRPMGMNQRYEPRFLIIKVNSIFGVINIFES